MIVVPYKAEHLLTLELQASQRNHCAPLITPEYAKLVEGEFSFTAMAGGLVIAVAGLTPLLDGRRALAWSFISRDAGPHFFALTKAVIRLLDASPYVRVEAEVQTGFMPGHRWLRRLGFRMEAPRMRKFMPDGSDASLYARVR